MGFTFSLESILRLRIGRERQEELRLETAALKVRMTQERCDLLKKERTEFERKMTAAMQSGMPSSELYLYMQGRLGLERAAAEAAHALVESKNEWSQQKDKFLAARREREIMSSMRDRQLAEYRVQEARREQQRIDDLFAMRRLRPNG